MPLPVAPTNADIAPPSPRETAAASPSSPTNLLLDNTPSSGGAAGETRPVTVNGSPQTTRPHPISPHLEGWIWPGKIRTGELVVLVGESGAGASTVTSDWIARLTRGMSFPGCRPQDPHPVAEVLLFNSLEDYSRTVLPRLAEMGGDPGKVLLASDQLLAWGAGEIPGDQPPLEGREAQTRVRLHTAAALEKLDQLLKRRPNIRLVVIDQLKLFLRTDSERVFEGLIQELTAIARTNDVTLVLTQCPDAFRKSGGPARYLKSPSLVQCARSIWRVVASEEDPFGDRVLDCLKLSHPVRKEKPGPWHLRLPAFGPLEWVRGNGGALLASTATSHEQALK
ncbi:MAG: AAA family ATPase, partial [Planctomycetaceae bacterium]